MTLCSACIVPVSAAFRTRGASIEATISIAQGSSTLNLPALVMTAMVFAPMIGGTRILLSVAGAILIGPIAALAAGQLGRSLPACARGTKPLRNLTDPPGGRPCPRPASPGFAPA